MGAERVSELPEGFVLDEAKKNRTSELLMNVLGAAIPPVGAARMVSGGMEMLDKAANQLGGAVTDQAAKVLPPEAAAAVGTAANVGVNAIPSVAGGGVGAMAKAPGAAKALMQQALKPVLHQIETGKAARAIQTMLDEGVPATKKGVEMLTTSINELEHEVAQKIAAANGVVDKTTVLSNIRDVLTKFRNQVNPDADLATIRKSAKEFFNHPLFRGKQGMSVQEAQSVKQGTYRELGDKAYGTGQKTAAQKDAQKALAKGLKEEIERIEPEVGPLNKKLSDDINALKVLARRTGMEANMNPVGIGWMINSPGHLGLWAWLAERSPAVKSMLARGLYTGSMGRGAGALTGAGLSPGLGLLDEEE